jgi:hypothetical protein
VTGHRIARRAGPLTLAVVALLMLTWTWRAWPDILIDFGREVYVPWQLASGKVLYRDIAYFSGPLSPYLNSLWFRAFGAHLDVLLTANLLLLVLLLTLLHHLMRTVSERLSAFVACLVFLVLFAFAQYVMVGNYNYVAPYSHELTHGLVLALAGIACIGAYAKRRRTAWLLCAGLAVGLVFLTKIEIFLAALLAVLAGLTLVQHADRSGQTRTGLRVGLFTGAALAPVVAAYLLLRTAMSGRAALDGLVQQFAMVTDRGITASPFYTASMGTDDPVGNLLRMLAWFGGCVLVLAPAFAASLAIRPTAVYRRVAAAGLFALTAVVLSLAARGTLWLEAFRALPLVLLVTVAIAAFEFRSHPRGPARARLVVRISLVVFAFTLLGKIALNARLYSYGFALAMPAALLFVVLLVGWLPALADRLGGYGAALRAAALAALVTAGAGHLAVMQAQLMEKSYTVASAAGTIRTDPVRGPVMSEVLHLIERHVGARQSLAVLPEGAMVNFLTRRVNPTPYVNFMPVELATFGEERMLQAFRTTPPDVVLLVHKDVAEYGLRYFGADYGRALGEWIGTHYERVATVGEPPRAAATGFGVELLRYRAAPPRERGTD